MSTFDAAQLIQRELDPHEKLLWSGTPQQGLLLRTTDIFMIPFSLAWGGFSLYWEYSVITEGSPISFVLFGLLFVSIGIYLILGRFWADAALRRKTFYGITDSRVIILSGLFRKNIHSISLGSLTDISLTEKPDGRGTISLEDVPLQDRMYEGTPVPGRSPHMSRFESIERARTAYNILRDAQQDAARQ